MLSLLLSSEAMLSALRHTSSPNFLSRSICCAVNTAAGLFGIAGLHIPQDWPALVTSAQARYAELAGTDSVTGGQIFVMMAAGACMVGAWCVSCLWTFLSLGRAFSWMLTGALSW